MVTDASKMQPYHGPVGAQLFPHLTISLLGMGLIFTAWFFVSVATSTKQQKSIVKELLGAAIASAFLGSGTVFLMLWVGIYV